MDFVPSPLRRQSSLIPVIHALAWALIVVPPLVVVVRQWPSFDVSLPTFGLTGIGVIAMAIEDRLANLLNEAQEINALLRNIVTSPDEAEVSVRDIVGVRRALNLDTSQ